MRLLTTRRGREVAFILALLAVAIHPAKLRAHASLIGSDPADRAVVAQAPDTLKLMFNEPVSPLVLRLVGPTGEAAVVENVIATGNTIAAPLPKILSPGTHLLSWRVISLDGHPVGGTLIFSFGAPSASPATRPDIEANNSLRVAIWLAKLVFYIGLLGGTGGAFYGSWIATTPLGQQARKPVAFVLDCGLAAAVVSIGLQGLDVLGLPTGALLRTDVWIAGFKTSFGWTVGIAIAAFVVGRIALAAAAGAPVLSLLATIGAGASLAASGHAAAAEPQLLARLTVFSHAIAVTFWVGALWPLMKGLRSPRAHLDELLRFSRAIPAAVALLVASGTVLAVIQLRQIDALWTTDYGLVLSAKLLAVVMVAALAATNRYWFTPRIVAGDRTAGRGLVDSIAIELAAVLVILGLVATWRFTPPPRSLLAASDAPIHLHIHGDKAMAELTIAQGAAGRSITVTVLDGQFGPLRAKEVALVLAKPDSGIEPLRIPASPAGDITWKTDHVHLPVRGAWQLRVEILVSDFEKITLEDQIELSR